MTNARLTPEVKFALRKEAPPQPGPQGGEQYEDAFRAIREDASGDWYAVADFPRAENAASNRAARFRKRADLADFEIRGSRVDFDGHPGSVLFVRLKPKPPAAG